MHDPRKGISSRCALQKAFFRPPGKASALTLRWGAKIFQPLCLPGYVLFFSFSFCHYNKHVVGTVGPRELELVGDDPSRPGDSLSRVSIFPRRRRAARARRAPPAPPPTSSPRSADWPRRTAPRRSLDDAPVLHLEAQLLNGSPATLLGAGRGRAVAAAAHARAG